MEEGPVGVPFEDGREEMARRVAREEIASLCGLVLRRLQEREEFIDPSWSEVIAMMGHLSEIWGEALRDFTSESEPGE